MRFFARFKLLSFLAFFAFFALPNIYSVAAQEAPDKGKTEPTEKAQTEKTDKSKSQTAEKKIKLKPADAIKNATAEQVAESVISFYSGLVGRDYLKQIRKTTIERGKITTVNADGKSEQSNYETYILRGDSLDKERIRFEQEFPNARYALVYNKDKIFGIFNDKVFAPREDATKSFQNQIWHGLEAVLRYKENGSTLALADQREKQMGVEFYVLDVTDKQNRKTRFYVSTKSLRVMSLEYTEDGVKYRRKFYDYNYAQGTLVPFRTVLWADDKQVEETSVQTISFGQRVEEDIFNEG